MLALTKQIGLEVVIIRPPLDYELGVKANVASLLVLIDENFLLPFGQISNNRFLIAIENLVSLIVLCKNYPKAANAIFLISKGEDGSAAELIRREAQVLGKNHGLFQYRKFC